jgi:acyl carrier protein
MTREEIFLKFQDILTTEFAIEKDLITPGARLYEDLELDSIDVVDLLVKMKGFLSGNIEPDKFKKALTIQDVVDIIHPLVKTPNDV